MNEALFDEFLQSVQQMDDIVRGLRTPAHVLDLEPPRERMPPKDPESQLG